MCKMRGFTVIEVCTVLGIVSLLITLGVYLSVRSYHMYIAQEEQQVLLDTLLLARARAQATLCEGSGCTSALPQGVHIQPDSFVVFGGNTFKYRMSEFDLPFPRTQSVSFLGTYEYVFAPGSGVAMIYGDTQFGTSAPHAVTVHPNGAIAPSLQQL